MSASPTKSNGPSAGELNSLSLPFVEALYDAWKGNPSSVATEWSQLFEEWDGQGNGSWKGLGPTFTSRGLFGRAPSPAVRTAEAGPVSSTAGLQERIDRLIRNFRVRGHIAAALDPLGAPRPQPKELDPTFLGFTEEDYDRPFSTLGVQGPETQTLRRILERMQNTYCRNIGAQFMHIDDLSIRSWLQERMEGTENRLTLSRDTQLRILTRLIDAVVFEEFIQKKYVGAKRFSLQGAESLIPLLDLAIEEAAEEGIREIVMGMAHRGRLNVLANILGKNPRRIFREFEDIDPERHVGRGDVKYHLGYSSDWHAANGRTVHLSLCFNPSHLEYVNPVALGRMRAKQDRFGDTERKQGMTLLIHGDAAFIGEGIVQETLNLSELDGYRVGGTIHVIVNNQIGFTTGVYEARSTPYATDVAKMLQSPIFHVNGEHPEAVAQVVKLAMDFRRTFHRDVVIDMYCYRYHGHNEGDEPAFTQPLMYSAIERRKPVLESYRDHLLELGGVTRQDADRIAEDRQQHLEKELSLARSDVYLHPEEPHTGAWQGYQGGKYDPSLEVDTGVDREQLAALLERLTEIPKDFHVHPKLKRLFQRRRDMALGKIPLDWSSAEALAMASLAVSGVRVRLSGQDSQRGTFSQRHGVLHDVETAEPYEVFQSLSEDQAPVELINSPLSEAGVLGFEYGYSLDCPDGLVMWEAQFGDFVNAAQVIIDQFIASAEDKWRRLSGLVLLLPHGFEGQGPEHSSARLERALLLCAEDNLQIVQPTTPAQFFHVLRRQVIRRWRKPMIVMTPKSLLRHPACVSSLDECAVGRFQHMLPDYSGVDKSSVTRILICSGKVYYELDQHRADTARHDVALLRMEQLYPTPVDLLQELLSQYPAGTPVYWVQEEPENMGAWRFLYCQFGPTLFGRHPFHRVSRCASASPATGSASSHKLEQEVLLAEAFAE